MQRLVFFLVLISACNLPAIPCCAQEEVPRVDINFKGGNLSEYYQHLRENGYTGQWLMTDEVKVLVIPPVTVSSTPAFLIPDLTQAICQDAFELEFNMRRGNNYSDMTRSNIFALHVKKATEVIPERGKARLPSKTIGVVTLASIFREDVTDAAINEKLEIMMRAIECGIQLMADAGNSSLNAPQFRFHPESRLLFVVGTKEELQLVNTVLRQLGTHGSEQSVFSGPQGPLSFEMPLLPPESYQPQPQPQTPSQLPPQFRPAPNKR